MDHFRFGLAELGELEAQMFSTLAILLPNRYCAFAVLLMRFCNLFQHFQNRIFFALYAFLNCVWSVVLLNYFKYCLSIICSQ